MANTKIIVKTGQTEPGTILSIAEPAFDSSNNILYLGKGLGNDAIPFYPNAFFFYYDTFNGGNDWTTAIYDYVYGGFDWVTPIPDKISGGTW